MNCLSVTSPFVPYLPLNMEMSRSHMERVAHQVSRCFYAVQWTFMTLCDILLNGCAVIYNIAIFPMNQAVSICSVFHRVVVGEKRVAGRREFVENQFTREDLRLLRSALSASSSPENRLMVFIGNLSYSVWWNEADQRVHLIDMQTEQSLTLRIDGAGHILSARMNEQELATFPEQFVLAIFPCIEEALRSSSKHRIAGDQNEVQVDLIRRGLAAIPEWHLDALGTVLSGAVLLPDRLRIKFLNDHLGAGDAVDAGGLSRDYFDDLFTGLLKSQGILHFAQENIGHTPEKMVLPVAPDGPLSQEELSLFKKMGNILSFCYLKKYLIGNRFHPGFFDALVSFKREELALPFEQLPDETHFKAGKLILGSMGSYAEFPTLLSKENWDENDRAVIGALLAMEGKNDVEIRNELRALFLGKIDKYLRPIHAIAQGLMDGRTRWGAGWENGEGAYKRQIEEQRAAAGAPPLNDPVGGAEESGALGKIPPLFFNVGIQGSLDRNQVAQAFQLDPNWDWVGNQHGREQHQWIQEWISDLNTPIDQVMKFLKFATGSSVLAPERKILVRTQLFEPNHFPLQAHTCTPSIDLVGQEVDSGEYNNRTKEELIRAIKEIAFPGIEDYSMA